MWKVVLGISLTAAPVMADVTTPGGKVIDCYCTDSTGGRVELGQTICLVVGGRAFIALCDMSLNVPIWRDTGTPCLSSSLGPGGHLGQPGGDAGLVDAEIASPEAGA